MQSLENPQGTCPEAMVFSWQPPVTTGRLLLDESTLEGLHFLGKGKAGQEGMGWRFLCQACDSDHDSALTGRSVLGTHSVPLCPAPFPTSRTWAIQKMAEMLLEVTQG